MKALNDIKTRLKKPTPIFFKKLSKKLKAIAVSSAGLGVYLFTNQEAITPIALEIGKVVCSFGAFGGFIGSVIADLTTTEDA